MKTKRIIVAIAACVMLALPSLAQTNTFYFMDELPGRHVMNPAYFPNTKVYVDFIVMPSFYLNMGNNDFTLKDFIYREKKNSPLTSPLHSTEQLNRFYHSMKPTSITDFDFGLDVLSFGFMLKDKHFITFDWNIKGGMQMSMPRDMFKLAFFGTPEEYGINSYDFKTLGINASVYSDLGLGYMQKINDKWTVGGKLKFYIGHVNVSTKINELSLDASKDEWKVKADATLRATLPAEYQTTTENGHEFVDINSFAITNDISKLLKPSGLGAGIDLGATFKPIENLTISAAITDLGFTCWYNNIISQSLNGEATFTGVHYKPGDSINFNNITDEMLKNIGTKSEAKKYFEMMTMNANVGIEYGILKNKISFGLLSRTKVKGRLASEEVTLAANFRPAEWFKTTLSYSFVNGRWNNLGLGLNLRVGPINTYLIADYIPLNWALISQGDGSNKTTPVPYNTQRVNLQMGMCLNINRFSSDWDQDGVRNKKDQCPDTDIKGLMALCKTSDKSTLVTVDGCDQDDDQDGVHNCIDQCPDTPLGVQVDSVGCPVDSDHDGVPDYLDKCPNTPEGVQVNSDGCPVDSDGDGVPDYLDKCPNTPEGVQVDSVGCPFDTDGDGVYDYLDLCPGTPAEAYGTVDENGCPKDSDGDGVADYLDKCPNTPEEAYATVDENGCPKDSDGDGVPDYMDKCPNTPAEAYGTVDEFGCPKDTDGDGIPDYKDKCPTVAGPASNYGCPELKKEIKNLFKKAMQGIQFETGKDIIKPVSFPILNQIADVMKENPTYNLAISGHTDNVGKEDYNLQLSDKRAASVRRYLINQGVDDSRMTSQGYGMTRPIADNKTKKGRALNRRVEFEVSFEEVTYEKIINEELKDMVQPTDSTATQK